MDDIEKYLTSGHASPVRPHDSDLAVRVDLCERSITCGKFEYRGAIVLDEAFDQHHARKECGVFDHGAALLRIRNQSVRVGAINIVQRDDKPCDSKTRVS